MDAPAPAHTPLTGDLTFRKDRRETGLAGIARPFPDTAIKIAGRQVGTIHGPTPRGDGLWSVTLTIADPTERCGWKRIRLARRFDDEPAARIVIQRADATLRSRHPLHAIED